MLPTMTSGSARPCEATGWEGDANDAAESRRMVRETAAK
jgi:hypothetical protein